MTARQKLLDLHKKHGFMVVNDARKITEDAKARRRILARQAREESWNAWMEIPQEERIALWRMVDRAKSTMAYREATA